METNTYISPYVMAMESFDETVYLSKESGYTRQSWHNKQSGVMKAKRAARKLKNRKNK